MARVTVEDSLDGLDKKLRNPFALIIIAAARCRQLQKGAKPTIKHSKNKAVVVALREIAEGHVYYEGDLEDVLRTHMH